MDTTREPLSIRRATPDDAGALALLGAATFLETYALDLPGRDIVVHCAKVHVPEVYAGWLSDPQCAMWVAEAGEGRVAVGYAALTPSVLPEAHEDDLELRRIYLLSRFQGGGSGRALMKTAVAEARARGAARLTLGMYGENHAALAFYTRMGFSTIGTREFVVGEKVCFDYVLGRPL